MHSPVTRSVLAWALRSAALLVVAAAVTKLLPAVEPEGGKTAVEPALLRWKWSPDSEWVAEFHQQVTTDSTFGAKTLRLAIESRFTQRWLVRSVDAQGAATLQQSYTKIAVSVDMGMGNTIAFDTDRPANPMGESRRLADALQPLVGPTWTLVVSPRGEVLRLEPSAEAKAAAELAGKNSVVQPLFASDGAIGLVRQAFVPLPEEPVMPGGGWRTSLPWKASFGVGEIAHQYTYEGVRPQDGSSVAAVRVESRIDAKPGPGKVTKGRELKEQKIVGLMLFDLAGGTLVESRQTQSLRSESRVRDVPLAAQLSSELTVTIRKPDAKGSNSQ
jgi:hypothetical protein